MGFNAGDVPALQDEGAEGDTLFSFLPSAAVLQIDASAAIERFAKMTQSEVAEVDRRLRATPGVDRGILAGVTVLGANARALEMFGAAELDELLGREVVDLYHPRCPALLEAMIGFSRGVPVVQRRSKHLKRDGRCFQATSCTVTSAGILKPGEWTIALTDALEGRSHLADAPVPPEDFAHSSRMSMIGELSASIFHEIGQPLTALKLNAQTALGLAKRGDADPGLTATFMERIIAQAARVTSVAERVRRMARRSAPLREPVCVGALVLETGSFVAHDLGRRGVDLVLEPGPETLLISADPVQIEQTLINLIMNAAQMMEAAGTDDPHVVVRYRRRGEFVVIEVEDNGPGIAGDVWDKLFSPFFTTRSDGLGVGLSIARTMIELHGGSVSGVNASQRGALFAVRLPLAPG
jgi:signal transduction histidine kinase